MRRAVILIVLFIGMQSILPLGDPTDGARTLLTFGFLVLAAYTMGEVARAVRLPKIVGYLVAGVLFGPSGLETVSAAGTERLASVSQLAIALIALLAGAELRWGQIRDQGVALLKMMTVELAFGYVALATLLFAIRDLLPFLRDRPPGTAIAFALLFASIAIVHSPAVTIALLNETGARGPVARSTLGIVLLVDIAVVLLFSLTLAVTGLLLPAANAAPPTSTALAIWEIAGALLVGGLLGGAVALYLRHVGRELPLFAIIVAFFGIEIAQVAHVELLLMLLTTGFVTENLSKHSGALHEAMTRSAAPVFVVFFALSGAKIDVASVTPLLPLVIPIAAVRAGAIWAGMRVGARWARVGGDERRLAWMGLISQAGVAIGLATIVAEAFGELGAHMRDLFLALIAVNETVGPILFRRALARSGEIDAGSTDTASAPLAPEGPPRP